VKDFMDTLFDFATFPTLETKRLHLRQITRADAQAFIALYSDPEVLRYIIVEPPCTTVEQALEMISWMNGHFESRNAVRWGITERDGDDTLIGTCGFHYYAPEHRRVDVGYDLQKAYWGKGYVTEAAGAVVRWCFENLNLHRIQADCTAGNIGSERVLEKLGFTYEGLWRERDFENGHFVDIKQFGLLRREYKG
jgi:[ribosomal protein S5]-alanine N-acetyltransferase